ncbi:MAG TPA: hypothetical protein VHH73_07400 [Verrucomicrobiae bacterium]|nr:hypothetical protein [Verrucomicrobiae bacterium]
MLAGEPATVVMRIKKSILLALTVAVAVGLAGILGDWGRQPAVTLPSPNGYDVILAAGSNSQALMVYIDESSKGELSAWVAKNQLVLEQLRRGLSFSCTVPPAVLAPGNLSQHMGYLALSKQCARLLVAEGTLHELAGHPDLAAQGYVDAIRLGCAVIHGGRMSDHLNGEGCAALGTAKLKTLKDKLGPKDCRWVAAELARSVREVPPAAETMRREREVYRQHAGLGKYVWARIQRMIPGSKARRTDTALLARINRSQQALTNLAREFEDRAKEMEEGPAR